MMVGICGIIIWSTGYPWVIWSTGYQWVIWSTMAYPRRFSQITLLFNFSQF